MLNSFAHGVTPNYTPVRLEWEGCTPGQPVQVQIIGTEEEGCIGRKV